MICADNHGDNIWNKIKISSEIGQNEKASITTSA